MHSCSDKRELVRSGAAQHMIQFQPLKRQHTAVWPGETGKKGGREGEKRGGEASLFNSWVLQGLW